MLGTVLRNYVASLLAENPLPKIQSSLVMHPLMPEWNVLGYLLMAQSGDGRLSTLGNHHPVRNGDKLTNR